MNGTEPTDSGTRATARRLWRVTGRPFWRAALRFIEHEGPELAGYIAFSMLLALFPFVLFLVALAGLLGQNDAVQDLVAFAFEYLPVEVGRTLFPVVSDIVLRPPVTGVVTLSMIGTLWVASSGVEALRTALDRAYGVAERRAFWWRRLQGLGFVIGGAFAILLATLLIVVGPLLWQAATALVPLPLRLEALWNTVRYLAGGLALVIVVWCFYRLLPNVRQRWFEAVPGAVFSVAAWLAAATLYSLYLGNIANYSVTYGSLGGIIGALMFFFLTATIFIYGAELNHVLMARRDDGDGAPPAGP